MHEYAVQTRRLLDYFDSGSSTGITQAARLILDAIRSDGLVHVAGAGHSLAMVCESFYRAGGLACVRPIWHERLLPLRNAIDSTNAERESGLAQVVMAERALAPPDVVVLFSTSGANPYPVELAAECRERGVPVLAFTSMAATRAAAQRTETRLVDHATVVIDTRVPPGDVTYPGAAPRTSPVSTILAAYAWSRLLAELDDLAERTGVALPRWTSANMPGGDLVNDATLRSLSPRIPELGVTTPTTNAT